MEYQASTLYLSCVDLRDKVTEQNRLCREALDAASTYDPAGLMKILDAATALRLVTEDLQELQVLHDACVANQNQTNAVMQPPRDQVRSSPLDSLTSVCSEGELPGY